MPARPVIGARYATGRIDLRKAAHRVIPIVMSVARARLIGLAAIRRLLRGRLGTPTAPR